MYKNYITYEINEKNLTRKGGENYTTYGIDCFEIENGFKRLVNQIIDISSSRSKTQDLVDLLNSSKLSYIHIYDTIEDFISSDNE